MPKITSLGPIAIDVMGSDHGPSEIIEGIRLALANTKDPMQLVLVGDQAVINPILCAKKLDKDSRVSIFHASEVVDMDEKPIQSLKNKKDASIFRAIELVKQGKAQAILSCGNTGSLMAGSTIKLRTMQGIERPALATLIPSYKSHFILIDAGANPEPTPEHLVHNAVLGSHYARMVLKKPNPRVSLLTIGTEEGKGTQLVNEAHNLLKKVNGLINYTGPIEGFSLFDGGVDVVVCDGFVGNIVLKSCESLFMNMKQYIKEEIMKTMIRKVGALLCKGAFDTIKENLSPERYGGVPLLGLKGTVIKAHGSSNRYAIMHAVRITREILQYDLNEHIHETILSTNAILGNDPLKQSHEH